MRLPQVESSYCFIILSFFIFFSSKESTCGGRKSIFEKYLVCQIVISLLFFWGFSPIFQFFFCFIKFFFLSFLVGIFSHFSDLRGFFIFYYQIVISLFLFFWIFPPFFSTCSGRKSIFQIVGVYQIVNFFPIFRANRASSKATKLFLRK